MASSLIQVTMFLWSAVLQKPPDSSVSFHAWPFNLYSTSCQIIWYLLPHPPVSSHFVRLKAETLYTFYFLPQAAQSPPSASLHFAGSAPGRSASGFLNSPDMGAFELAGKVAPSLSYLHPSCTNFKSFLESHILGEALSRVLNTALSPHSLVLSPA